MSLLPDLRSVVALCTVALFSYAAAASETPAPVASGPPELNIVAQAFILFGSVFVLLAGIGMMRFPDFYTRLHASSKLVTLGGIGVFGGAALALINAGLEVFGHLALVVLFFFLTSPLSGYMIGRSGYLRGLKFYTEEHTVDEWGAFGSVNSQD